MTQEQKDLLLKDLSARLPYGVKFESENAERVYFIDTSDDEIYINGTNIEDVKPYLFPLSSMSEEQKKYITDRWGINEYFDFEINPDWGEYFVELGDTIDFINWLNENHFDYRGFIYKGLAIDATNLNIY